MSDKFKTFIERAFAALAIIMSGHLGDRSQYIGASDVSGCPLKATLSRTKPIKNQHTVAAQMIMTLGHAIEDIVARLFEAGGCKNIKREVELAHPEFPWLKCHVDFWAETDKEIRIRELKSTKGLPNGPYDSWVKQLHFQMGLAGINNPMKSISGSIMVVDRICGGIGEHNGYMINKPLFDSLVAKATKIWAAVKGEGPLPEPEPNEFCGSCPYREECPIFRIKDNTPVVPDEIAEMMSEYFILDIQSKKLKADQDVLKERILGYAGKSNSRFRAVSDNGFLLTVTSVKGRETIDKDKLASKFPEALETCLKKGTPSVKMEITAIKANQAGGVV